MIEITITQSNVGRRLDKFLFAYLSKAPTSFVYKMLRKKNIVLNGKKSDGKELLSEGDIVKLFLSDETIDKFSNNASSDENTLDIAKLMPDVIYEDENIILVNKPAGMLSQKSSDDSVSANEIILAYLMANNSVNKETLKEYVPSICNRLDRNTCGILIFAKTYQAARELSKALKDRTIHKYYKCVALGCVTDKMQLSGRLSKDSVVNKVSIDDSLGDEIRTDIYPVKANKNYSLLEILLITGKTHQIRAHLASIGHPLAGDYKYGNRRINDKLKAEFCIESQLLCAYKLVMPEFKGQLAYLSNRIFEINIPKIYEKVLNSGNVENKRS